MPSYTYRGRRSGMLASVSATVAAAAGGTLGASSGPLRNRRASIDGSLLMHPAAVLGGGNNSSGVSDPTASIALPTTPATTGDGAGVAVDHEPRGVGGA